MKRITSCGKMMLQALRCPTGLGNTLQTVKSNLIHFNSTYQEIYQSCLCYVILLALQWERPLRAPAYDNMIPIRCGGSVLMILMVLGWPHSPRIARNPLTRWAIFPESVQRVPVSLWGCGGWAVLARRCATVRNRPQPSATVRNRSQPFATVRARSLWPCLWEVLQKGPFWSFPASHSFISHGRRRTLWDSNMFHDVSKMVLRGKRNTFATFSED